LVVKFDDIELLLLGSNSILGSLKN